MSKTEEAGLPQGELPTAPCPNPYADGRCYHLTCARCGQHTNNNTQGHYWAWCGATRTLREHHFCCPGKCELQTAGEPKEEETDGG